MRSILLVVLLSISFQASARVAAYEFENSNQESTYNDLINELRCLVCQNQTIADSNAELAQDMKRKTHELVMQGKSKKEISDFMVQRYGNFVQYKPPVTSTTYLLWTGPFIILFIGLFILIKIIRNRKVEKPVELSDNDKSRAADLLNSKGE
ncbi:MAG: cytochrome c-type biogenesis protein CcmH [Gammaproteobacteria bacterium]|nr:cytochrome c-type biogenesis protein CcmH [Gammaproteobacteria bacterium]